jgi:uridine kinase
MTSERIILLPEYERLGQELLDALLVFPALQTGQRCVVGIAGESGSGKSVAAQALKKALIEKGIGSATISMDHFFHLPPKANHTARELNIRLVGPQEVNLGALEATLDAFKQGAAEVEIPLTDYANDTFTHHTLSLADTQVLLVEGTYVLRLPQIDIGVYLDRNYEQTLAQRQARNRDIMSPFIEQVLSIEHDLIRSTRPKAHLIIDVDYRIQRA